MIKMLCIFLFVTVVLMAILYYIHASHIIQEVYVEGNVHYTKEQIEDIIMKGPPGFSFLGQNSLYLAWRYKNAGNEEIPFVDIIDVDILSSHTIKITVYEKSLAGYVSYLDGFMYFDKDGFIVESSKVKTVGVPQIMGLDFDHVILGAKLPVEKEEVFDQIMTLTSLLSKYELPADRITFQDAGNITITFGTIRCALGNGTNLEDKIMRIPKILPLFEGKSGILHMENVSEDNSNATFTPDK
jgi:cell division protein FtsQ